MENSELTTDTAGKPMAGIEARLVDWEEGEYRVTDRPNPRGEILLAGDPIAKVKDKINFLIQALFLLIFLYKCVFNIV